MRYLIDAVAILAVSLLATACGLCEDVVMNRWSSPTKESDVILVRRNCGATTSYSYLLAVIDGGHVRIDDEDVFYASTRPIHPEAVTWASSDSIVVREAVRTEFRRRAEIKDIAIGYAGWDEVDDRSGR